MKHEAVSLPVHLIDLVGEVKREVPRELEILLPKSDQAAKVLKAVAIARPDDPAGIRGSPGHEPESDRLGTLAQVYYFLGPDGTLWANILCYHWHDGRVRRLRAREYPTCTHRGAHSERPSVLYRSILTPQSFLSLPNSFQYDPNLSL